MQELQAIPDSKRTEAEWEELNELEISLASVNQNVEGDKGPRQNAPSGGGGGGGGGGESRGGRSSKGGRKPSMRGPRRAPRAAPNP